MYLTLRFRYNTVTFPCDTQSKRVAHPGMRCVYLFVGYPSWAHTCTENVPKTRFQDVQNVDSEHVHKT